MKPTLLIMLMAVFALAGCGSDNSVAPAPGELRMFLVDRTGAYEAVNLVVTEVSVHAAGVDSVSGWIVVNDSTRVFDLLSLVNGASAVLGDQMLSPGHYTQIRLKLGVGSTVVVEGQSYPLEVPSGLQSGLKLNHEFDIASGTLYELSLDFDASRSIRDTGGGQYRLAPVIRLVATATTGTISGIVHPESPPTTASTVAGADTVSAVADTTSGAFKLMALPAGSYNVRLVPSAPGYVDSTITGVSVIAGQDTDLGTINLRD